MSVVHHGPIHEQLNTVLDSISYDADPLRTSVISSLVPNSVAVAAR